MPAKPSEPLSYGEFGETFILCTVTPSRVVQAVQRIAGNSVALGPLRAGPLGSATVEAKGRIGAPVAEETGSDPLRYAVRLPVDMDIEVRVGAHGHFRATGEIELRMTVRTLSPLTIVIDVDTVAPADARFGIHAVGVQSRLLQRAGDVEGELRRHAASYVNERINRPEAARFTRIELEPLIEMAWGQL